MGKREGSPPGRTPPGRKNGGPPPGVVRPAFTTNGEKNLGKKKKKKGFSGRFPQGIGGSSAWKKGPPSPKREVTGLKPKSLKKEWGKKKKWDPIQFQEEEVFPPPKEKRIWERFFGRRVRKEGGNQKIRKF